MNRLTFYLTICYAIPFFFPQFFLGLCLSYLLKILGNDLYSNRINNHLAYTWLRLFLFFTRTKLISDLDKWEPGQSKKFIICNHTNALEVPIVVGLPYLKHTPNLNLSYLGGDIIQRYKLIPLMMHARIVEAVTYSEKKPNFRNFKKDVLYVLERRTIFLFPEGKRTYSEEILPFETGVMKIAYKFQIDLDIFVVGGLMKFSDDTKFIHFRKNNLVYVAFCGKIQASEHASFESYLQCAEKMMKEKKENLDTLYFPN